MNITYTTSALILLLGFVLAFSSCKKDDDPEPVDMKEEISFDAEVSATMTEADQAITFTDHSTGVTSRSWTFPGGTPATSTAEKVDVSFSREGPVICSIEVMFHDGTTDTKSFTVQVGNELYARTIFGFEDRDRVGEAWKQWSASGNMDISMEVDGSQGADGTSACLKVNLINTSVESQIFTKENTEAYNAILESNKTYTCSFWIKGDVTKIHSLAVNNLWTVNGEVVQAFNNFVWISPVWTSDEWVKISKVFETGDLSETYNEGKALNAFPQFKFVPESSGIIYVDEISIKEGDFGTHIPEPVMLDAQVSSNQVEVGATLVFTDNSTGVQSRIWTFPGGEPSTSTDREVSVAFAAEGQVTCALEVTFVDETVQRMDFLIDVVALQQGEELYDRDVFGFEDAMKALDNWTIWHASGNEDLSVTVDESQGANGTAKCMKVTINNTGSESQILSRDSDLNAALTSGKVYTFSFWIKGEESMVLDGAEIFVGDNDPWTQYFWQKPLEVTADWQEVSFTFQADDPLEQAKADNVYTQFKIIPAAKGVIYIDEVSLLEK